MVGSSPVAAELRRSAPRCGLRMVRAAGAATGSATTSISGSAFGRIAFALVGCVT